MSSASTMNWKDLKFWKSQEWKELSEKFATFGDVITPHPSLVFRPLIQTRLPDVKTVFLYPEPYFKDGVANGLALSFNGSSDRAPIYFHEIMDALKKDVNVKTPATGDLTKWTQQGVLLWNTIPTALVGHSGVHRRVGWEKLTQEVLETVYLTNSSSIFVFFGPANEFRKVLPDDALCMQVEFPLGRDAKIFSTINKILARNRRQQINWRL